MKPLWIAWVLVLCLSVQSTFAGYLFVDLSPPGYTVSSAWGIDGGQQVGSGLKGSYHALLWNGTAGSVVDLHPAGYTESYIQRTSGGRQAGYGTQSTPDFSHALMWSGSAATVVDLHPVGFQRSDLSDIRGNEQVGTAYPAGAGGHAMRWSGTAASAIDLHPAGYSQTQAEGTSGAQQVGNGILPNFLEQRALLWSGTAASVVTLHPENFSKSFAIGVNGNEQVGYGTVNGSSFDHALLWHGTAASVVDLHPAGFAYSYLEDTNGINQVGRGITSDVTQRSHALLWSGIAGSVLDLQSYLPPMYPQSDATAIDALGNITGFAYDVSGVQHAVAWLVPEPASISLLFIGGSLITRRMRGGRSPKPGRVGKGFSRLDVVMLASASGGGFPRGRGCGGGTSCRRRWRR